MKFSQIDIRFLYVLYSWSFPWRFKWGKSDDVKRRRLEVERELSSAMNRDVRVRIAVYVPLMFCGVGEKRGHRWMERIRDKGMVRHSGYSEWFWFFLPNAVTGIIVYFGVWLWYGVKIDPLFVAFIAAQPFFPVAPALLAILTFLFEIAVVFGGLGLAGFVIYHAFQFIPQ